jgi:hypothetical protein
MLGLKYKLSVRIPNYFAFLLILDLIITATRFKDKVRINNTKVVANCMGIVFSTSED